MRDGFVSDVHGASESLERAIYVLQKAGYDRLWFLGDLVADYPPDPAETWKCIKILKDASATCILGNHDVVSYLMKDYPLKWFEEYMERAKPLVRENGSVYAHMGPGWPITKDNIPSAKYISTKEIAAKEFLKSEFDIAFLGHNHEPRIFGMDGTDVRFLETGEMKLDRKTRWIVNVGAIAYSRDSTPEISYALFDHITRKLTVFRG